MKKIILILLMGTLMNPTFHLYGIKITLAGDLIAARDRAHLVQKLMFQTKMLNVNDLDIIQNNLRLSDGTHVYVLSQHGLDSATIYVPPGVGKGKPEYIEKPMFEVIPYIFASNTVFERDGEPVAGLLVCHGGWDFSGWHELFSPYGDTALYDNFYEYSPYVYELVDGEHILHSWPNREQAGEDAEVVEWQVKEFWDYTRMVKREYEEREEWFPVYWDEIPWMTRYPRWDPVFYETYDDYEQDWGESKTYWAYSTYSGLTLGVSAEESDYYNWPLVHTYTANWDLIINNGTVLDSCWVNQWYEGTGVGKQPGGYENWKATWYNRGDMGSISNSAIDQEHPEKFGVIWYTSSQEASCTGYEFTTGLWNIPNEHWTHYDYKVKFKGLGHDEILPGGTAVKETTIRLYKTGEKYVCLFSYVVGEIGAERVYIGSAVEDGPFHVVDLTDGIMVNGEVKQVLIQSDRAMNFGILKRVEPVQRIKKEK